MTDHSDPVRVSSESTAEPRTRGAHPPAFLNYLHSVFAIPVIYFYTMVMGSLSLFLSLFERDGRRQHWCAQVWCRMIARTAGAPVDVIGLENLVPGQSYVFLSTHQSWMDIPAMLGYLPVQLRIAAKKSLFWIPFMGWHLQRAGHIPIDRTSTENAVTTLQRSADYLRDGVCVFIFPEGTRSADGTLHTFKKGGFRLAVQAGIPIVPITIIGSRAVLPRDSVIFRAGPIEMFIDSPIPTAGLTDEDLPELIARTRAAMLVHFRAG
jgi:1-acyl-sn-glycerol-3-phosphate acyltransferase